MTKEIDIFKDPQKVESILTDTYDKIKNAIRQDVLDIAKEYDDKMKTVSGLNYTIQAKQREAREMKNKVDEAYEKFRQSAVYDIPKLYMDRVVQEATGGYKPGDTVYVIGHVREHIRCSLCNGKRSINVDVDNSKREIVCPNCKGNGYKSVRTPVTQEAEIDTVYLKLGFSEKETSLWSADTIYLKGWGFPLKASDIYQTQDEAERAILKKTKEAHI